MVKAKIMQFDYNFLMYRKGSKMCWITTIFGKNVVKHLESLVCENGCHTMRKNGRFWPFSVGDSVQQANEVACLLIFYVVTQAGWKMRVKNRPITYRNEKK